MSDDEAFSEHELPTGSDTAQRSQGEMDAEMAAVIEGYEAGKAEHGEETQPRLNYPPYRSSVLRHPTKDPYPADPETIELFAPVFGHRDVDPLEADLTIQGLGEPSGELYDQAVQVVMRDKKASTSYIQRRLQIGYNRAASLMERMENEGIVGPANHAGKREILLETQD